MRRLKSKWEIEVVALYKTISRNLPGNAGWEGSFYEQLVEYGRWDKQEFWMLHFDITGMAKELKTSRVVEKSVALNLALLQTKIDNLIVAHFNRNDVFKIGKLEVGEILAYKERFDLAVLSVYTGEIIPESQFELTNPLMKFK